MTDSTDPSSSSSPSSPPQEEKPYISYTYVEADQAALQRLNARPHNEGDSMWTVLRKRIFLETNPQWTVQANDRIGAQLYDKFDDCLSENKNRVFLTVGIITVPWSYFSKSIGPFSIGMILSVLPDILYANYRCDPQYRTFKRHAQMVQAKIDAEAAELAAKYNIPATVGYTGVAPGSFQTPVAISAYPEQLPAPAYSVMPSQRATATVSNIALDGTSETGYGPGGSFREAGYAAAGFIPPERSSSSGGSSGTPPHAPAERKVMQGPYGAQIVQTPTGTFVVEPEVDGGFGSFSDRTGGYLFSSSKKAIKKVEGDAVKDEKPRSWFGSWGRQS